MEDVSENHNLRDNLSDIGDVITVEYITNDDMICQCVGSSTGKKCKSRHKYYYLGSGGERKIVCGRLSHRHDVTNTLLQNDNTATLFERVSQHEVSDGSIRVVYKAIGINITKANDMICPLVLNNIEPQNMRANLNNKISVMQNNIVDIKEKIDKVYSDIKGARTDLTKFQYVRREIEHALLYMRAHTSFMPDNNIDEQHIRDKCAICLDSMSMNDSCRLYECNHSFHKDCIRIWFGNKNNITCPNCRAKCDVDRYFKYNKYKNVVS